MSKHLLLFMIALLVVGLSPWQAFQNSWIIPPSGEIRIRWNDCLSAGGATVKLTSEQVLKGFIVENGSAFEPLLVTTCD